MSSYVSSSKSGHIPAIAGVGVIAIGCLALVGWAVDSVSLKSVLPSLRPMAPVAAIAFVLGGASLVLLSRTRPNRILSGLGRACAVLLAMLALTALIERLFGLNIAIDRWPFRLDGDVRVPASTAVSLLLAAIALLVLKVEIRRGWRPAQLLALTAIMIALLTLLGYSYGVVALYHINPSMFRRSSAG